MRKVISNPAGIASRKNQRKDSKASPVSTIKRMAMEGTGSGNCRGHGIHIPNASAIPRDPPSGAASARKASFGQGMKKMDTSVRKKVPGGTKAFIALDGLPAMRYGKEIGSPASRLS